MPSQRFKLVVAVMAALTVGTFLAEPYVRGRALESYKPAPEFALATIDGSMFRLSSAANGSLVVIDFMATWCYPCRKELQELSALRAMYPASGVVILSVDVAYTETAGQLSDFRNAYAGLNGSAEGQGWYFALDSVGEYVAPKYGANALPTLVLIDGQGRIRETWVGQVDAAQVARAIDTTVSAAA